MSALTTARTLLFVPGDRPERFAKATAGGADLVVVDLEDAVPTGQKETARSAVSAWLTGAQPPATPVAIRVNGAGTPWHPADVAAVAELTGAGLLAGVVLPKAEPGEALTDLGATCPTLALVETAVGVLDARAVAATPGVRRLAVGSLDLAAELGVDPLDQQALLGGRSALVYASAAAGLPGPVDGVRAAIDDEAGLREEAEAARRLGYAGKLCIHPRQVPVVRTAFAPTAGEVSWARRVLDAVDDPGATGATPDAATGTGAVVTVDGAMVDKPVLDRARRILAHTAEQENR